MKQLEAQKNNEVRECSVDEFRKAVFMGKRVKIFSDPDQYGYLYKDELYVRKDKE